MGARTRLIVVAVLALGLILGLTACMGQWFTPKQVATLIIGKLMAAGNRGEVVISVANMPNGGLAGIRIGKVGDEGITFTNIDASSIIATGLNGFTVQAQDFATNAGKGCLLAVKPATGSVGGPILKITFEVTGANPTLTIPDASKVELSSDLNTLITTWTLGTDKAYYAK